MQKWQQAPDREEAIETLPHLSLSDVERRTKATETKLMKIGKAEVLETFVDTNGIAYLNLYFDISDFDCEELKLAQVISEIFAKLGTKDTSAENLQTKIKSVFGFLVSDVKITAKPGDIDDCRTYFHVACGMLEKNIFEATELLISVLKATDYSKTDKIEEMLGQISYFMRQSLIGNGHSYAVVKALSPFSKAGTVNELISGESYIDWFSSFAKTFENCGNEKSANLAKVAAKIFASNRLFIGFAGNVDTREIEKIISSFPENTIGKSALMPKFDTSDCAVEIPAGVGYSALGGNLCAMGNSYHGSCVVLSSLVTYDYLWNEVRVKGGAYGTGMSIRIEGDIFCYSYRDPNVEKSREVFGNVSEFVKKLDEGNTSLEDVIISTVNSTDPHLTPCGKCDLECSRYLKGITFDYVMKIREEILDTKMSDIKKYTDVLKKLSERGKFCVVGDKSTVSKFTE